MSLPYIIKQKLFAQLLESTEHGLFVLDDQFRYVYVNENFGDIFGVVPETAIGKPVSLFKESSLSVEGKLLIDEILDALLLKNMYQGQVNLTIRAGHSVKASVKIYGIHVAGNIYYAGILEQRELLTSARGSNTNINYDPVTQLPYQQYFIVQLGDLLLDTVSEVVLARISFDRFRTLKTHYSSESIDEVLTDFVQRIYNLNLRNLVLFSRFDEDNFAMVFEVDNSQSIRNDLAKILQLAERPYLIGNHTIYLHYSIGVSKFPVDGNQTDVLLDNAEKALHYVKDKGGDDICWFDEKLNQVSAEKLRLETELRKALVEEQFFPVYQPKVDLITNKIVGFEALVRWQHPELGVTTPNYFLDSLLEYRLSFDLFCLMAEAVIRDLYRWQQHGLTQELCINADTYDFLHPNFTDFIESLLKKYPIRQGSLHLEVTENSLMQQYDIDVLAQFSKLKALGIQIALDDFGTGYASISYLRHYPFDYIKIDKSFVDDIEQENTQLLIVRAIIDLASALDLYTVAEGIESASQAQVMRDMGCVNGQGYYFGRPVPFEEASIMIGDKSVSDVFVDLDL